MLLTYKTELINKGFAITKPIFSDEELKHLSSNIDNSNTLYAKRQLIKTNLEVLKLIFNNSSFKKLYKSVCDNSYFLSKSIYFNKPKKSNWFVNYHQDMSISVKEKLELEGYSKWTLKDGQLGVIPPVDIVSNTITFRIHLDDTNATNGALRVIPKSHKLGIIRVDENFNKSQFETEELCNVEKGGVMLMSPLLLHASDKSTSDYDRRVIQLEFCNQDIPMGWLEKKVLKIT